MLLLPEHRDPVDRFLIWTAINEGFALVSGGDAFPDYVPHGLKICWSPACNDARHGKFSTGGRDAGCAATCGVSSSRRAPLVLPRSRSLLEQFRPASAGPPALRNFFSKISTVPQPMSYPPRYNHAQIDALLRMIYFPKKSDQPNLSFHP